MADLTTQTTFKHSVMGNKRVVFCDVSGTATSTADTIVVPLSFVEYANASFRASGVAGTSVAPAISVSNTTINVFQLAGTTGQNYTVIAYGR